MQNIILNVAQRINELIANAQKISRFGELEVIREEASLLVARLRNDIAYAELQYSLGTSLLFSWNEFRTR